MKMRPLVTLTLGVALAVGSVYLVRNQMNVGSGLEAAPPPFETVGAVVAAAPLSFGSRVGKEHLKETLWPAASLPEGAFTSIDQVLGANGEEPRVALRGIGQGELLTADNVSDFGGRATLSSILPDGKRAFSVKVDAVTGVAGFLLPGDYVDVLLTREQGQGRDPMSDLILQGIRIRGIDQLADVDRDKPQVAQTVTLEVTPLEAQKLALAQQVGRLTLALRNSVAEDKTAAQTVRVGDLVDGEKAVRGPTVRVRRGAGEASFEDVRR